MYELLQNKTVLGAEGCGVIWPEVHPCRDSYAAMALTLEKLAYSKLKVSEIMNAHAGIVRTEERLKEGLRKIEELATELMMSRKVVSTLPVKEYYEDAAWRLLIVASLIMNPALLRKESRGGHYREDFPHADESYEVHSIQQMGKEITTAPVNKDYLNF